MELSKEQALILKTLQEKDALKQQVYRRTEEAYEMLQLAVERVFQLLDKQVRTWPEPRPKVLLKEKGKHEISLTFGADVLVFNHHSNVFQFERSHSVWQSSYLREDEGRSFCGVIQIYNFLHDSLALHRQQDLGYMIARIFVNKDGHYFVEGKRQLGFLYNNFSQAEVSVDELSRVVESCMLYTLDFDLLVPNYDQVKIVSVEDLHRHHAHMSMGTTGKRLGFTFEADL